MVTTVAAVDTNKTLRDILEARITKDDLTTPYQTAECLDFLERFEDAWKKFLQTLPDKDLPRGNSGSRLEYALAQIEKLEKSKQDVEQELQDQLKFFRESREKMEDKFDAKLREASLKQRSIQEDLNEQLEMVSKVEELQIQTIPWFHYLDELNELVDADSDDEDDYDFEEIEGEHKTNELLSHAVKPSKRAMLLSLSKCCVDNNIDSTNNMLRAFRVDRAMLRTHISMLKKEIQRTEYLSISQERIAQFLSKHKVWNCMKKGSSINKKIVPTIIRDQEESVGTMPTAATSSYETCGSSSRFVATKKTMLSNTRSKSSKKSSK